MKVTTLVGIVSVLVTAHWALAQQPPQFTQQPTNATVELGGNAQFKVTVQAGTAPLEYLHWWFNNAAMDTNANPSAARSILTLTGITLEQAGPYFVMVTNNTGFWSTSQVAVLDVDPTFTKITTGPPVTDLGCSYGGSWRDYDGDGFDDLVVYRYLLGTSTIYRSEGDGSFTTVSCSSLGITGSTNGVVWSDLDSDGLPDLVTWRTQTEPYSLQFNNGDGTFSPVKLPGRNIQIGVIMLVDFDQDGMLDVFEGGMSTTNRLYRNLGNRTFIQMTSAEVGSVSAFKTRGGGAWADYDDDGWVDLYFADIIGPSRFYHNEGGGWFSAVTNRMNNATRAGDWGDYDNDGRVDLCVSVWDVSSFVYRNLGGGEFEKVSIGGTSQAASVLWADYDNDGFLDLFMNWCPTSDAAARNALYHNKGNGTFSRITTGSIVTDVPVTGASGFAAFWFDYDNDGFPDLYVPYGDDYGTIWATNFLYHNNGNANAWLKVRLVGTASNRDGIGAKVRIQAKFAGQVRWQRRDLVAGDVWCWNRPYAHFGLGDATNVDLVKIEWPSGIVQEFQNVSVKQTLTVTEHQDGAPPAPTLTATRSAEGAVQLTLTGQTDLLYVFEASTDLEKWTKLGVRTNLTGTVEFTDTWAPKYAQRFYRGVAP